MSTCNIVQLWPTAEYGRQWLSPSCTGRISSVNLNLNLVPCVVPLVPCVVPLVPFVAPLVPCVVPQVPCVVPLVPCVIPLVPCVVPPIPSNGPALQLVAGACGDAGGSGVGHGAPGNDLCRGRRSGRAGRAGGFPTSVQGLQALGAGHPIARGAVPSLVGGIPGVVGGVPSRIGDAPSVAGVVHSMAGVVPRMVGALPSLYLPPFPNTTNWGWDGRGGRWLPRECGRCPHAGSKH